MNRRHAHRAASFSCKLLRGQELERFFTESDEMAPENAEFLAANRLTAA